MIFGRQAPVGHLGAINAFGLVIDSLIYCSAVCPGTRVAAAVPIPVKSGPIIPAALGTPGII